MASTSFGFFGAAPTRQTKASAHSRAFFMGSRFFRLSRDVRSVDIAPGVDMYSCCTVPMKGARNSLILQCYQFGHEHASYPARIGGGREPWNSRKVKTKDGANSVSQSSGTGATN